MTEWTYEQLHTEYDKISLGLQYTIAERERLKCLLRAMNLAVPGNSEISFPEIVEAALSSNSERFQDIFALLFTGVKRNGFFVEFGACDGVAANNTLTLEKKFGWKGILAEPDRFWRDRLSITRTASVDFRCVSSSTGQKVKFFQSNRPGNSSPEKDHAYLGSVVDSYDVETVTLLQLLEDHHAPKHIDFLSIDTEGHEMEVLAEFDFTRYSFGFISIEEHPEVPAHLSVQPILEKAGYKQVLPRQEGRPITMQITAIDKFFVPIVSPVDSWELTQPY